MAENRKMRLQKGMQRAQVVGKVVLGMNILEKWKERFGN